MNSKGKSILGVISDVLLIIIIVIAIVVTVMTFTSKSSESGIGNILGYTPFSIQTDSMAPTFQSGDLIISKEVKNINELKVGDVITWKEDNSDWIVYFRRPEENAYFRAELRKCRYTTKIGEREYKIYLGGPIEIKQV